MRQNTVTITLKDIEGGLELSIVPETQIPDTGPLTDSERTSALIYKIVQASQLPAFNPSNN